MKFLHNNVKTFPTCSTQYLSTSDKVPCDAASKHMCKTPNKEHQPTSGTKMATYERDKIQNILCEKSILQQDRGSKQLFSVVWIKNLSNS